MIFNRSDGDVAARLIRLFVSQLEMAPWSAYIIILAVFSSFVFIKGESLSQPTSQARMKKKIIGTEGTHIAVGF